MKTFIIAFMMTANVDVVAVMPDEVKVPQRPTVKKTRGKGKGSVPYFAKYF